MRRTFHSQLFAIDLLLSFPDPRIRFQYCQGITDGGLLQQQVPAARRPLVTSGFCLWMTFERLIHLVCPSGPVKGTCRT